LTIVSASPRSGTDGKPSLKGAWLVYVKHLNFGGPNHISDGTAADRLPRRSFNVLSS